MSFWDWIRGLVGGGDPPAPPVAPDPRPEPPPDGLTARPSTAAMLECNEYRGVRSPLAWDELLASYAMRHARWMASTELYRHRSEARDAMNGGYEPGVVGSVIHRYPLSAREAFAGGRNGNVYFTGWMNSDGHRRILMNPVARKIGAAMAYDANGVPYWCVLVGS